MRSDADACAEARRSIARFLEGPLSAVENQGLRLHLDRCAECEELYRGSMESAGDLGRRMRTEREVRERKERRQNQRRMAFAGASGDRRSRLLTLRPLFWTALVIALLWNFTRSGSADTVRVEWEAGDVQASEGRVGATRPAELERGGWCSTGAESRARLRSGDTEAVLGPDSTAIAEGSEPLRLRLQGGSLSVSGEATVTTQLGIVTVQASAARIEVGEGRLHVRSLLGTTRVATALGEAVLAPGEEHSIDSGASVARSN